MSTAVCHHLSTGSRMRKCTYVCGTIGSLLSKLSLQSGSNSLVQALIPTATFLNACKHALMIICYRLYRLSVIKIMSSLYICFHYPSCRMGKPKRLRSNPKLPAREIKPPNRPSKFCQWSDLSMLMRPGIG